MIVSHIEIKFPIEHTIYRKPMKNANGMICHMYVIGINCKAAALVLIFIVTCHATIVLALHD